jgi:hypothetical protein
MKRIKNYKVLIIILGLSVFVLAACSASSKKEASPTISPTQTTDNPASSQPEPSSPESEKKDVPVFSTTTEKNGIKLSFVNETTLSEWEKEGKFTVYKGNLALYDSLLLDGSSAGIDLITDTREYKEKKKIGVSFDGGNSEQVSKILSECGFFFNDAVYNPYYLLVNNDKKRAILLFEGEMDKSEETRFIEQKDEKLLICFLSDADAGKITSADLSKTHPNINPLSYNATDTESADSYFEKANSLYKDGDYTAAEGFYLFALNKKDDLSKYKTDDVLNNLVLARLQLEKNEDALKMASDLVSRNSIYDVGEIKDAYGYLINLLVAMHANKLDLDDNEYLEEIGVYLIEIEDLLMSIADDNPGEFVHFMTAFIYNEKYIEMEKENGSEEDLEYIMDVLNELNYKENETFGNYDEDIEELKTYLSAKLEELYSTTS